jgi:ubiquinone/menaquinone biosynthesis C-methylase UbiE
MFSAPEKNIEQLGLREGEVVADFGAGSGAYTIAAAQALKGTGRVYAVEVQKDLLARLSNTCKEQKLGNVSYIWGDLEKQGGTKLRDGSCDTVIVSNILFQAPDKKSVIEEAKRVLKQSGRLLLIDWTASFKNMGPTPEQVFKETDAHAMVESMMFTFQRPINAGNHHYGLIFLKGLYQNRNPVT